MAGSAVLVHRGMRCRIGMHTGLQVRGGQQGAAMMGLRGQFLFSFTATSYFAS